jgi:O-antigen ligase
MSKASADVAPTETRWARFLRSAVPPPATRWARFLRVAFLMAAGTPTYNSVVAVPRDAQYLAIPIVLALYASQRRPLTASRGKVFTSTVVYLFIATPLALLGTNVAHSLAFILVLLVAGACVWVFVAQSGPEGVRQAVFDFSAAVVVVSSALIVAHRSDAVAGNGRWVGIFHDANTLGQVAAMAIVTGRRRTAPAYMIVAALAAIDIYGSGARSAALGAMVGVVLIFFPSGNRFRKLVILIVLGIAIPLTVSTLDNSTTGGTSLTARPVLTRTNNSRRVSWDIAGAAIAARPLVGYGAGNSPGEPADVFLKALEELGLFAAVPLTFLLWDGWRVLWRPGLLKPLYVVVFIQGLFESWLYSGDNMFFLIFLAASMGLAVEEVRTKRVPGINRPGLDSPVVGTLLLPPRRPVAPESGTPGRDLQWLWLTDTAVPARPADFRWSWSDNTATRLDD